MESQVKTEFVSMYDALINEGMEKGLEKGKQKGTQTTREKVTVNSFREGASLEFICKITDYTMDQVIAILKKHNLM